MSDSTTKHESGGDRLSIGKKFMFGAGDLTAAIPLTVISFYQLYFLTDVARLEPALAGWSILAVKLWDAFNDPLVGVLTDRYSGKRGRRRGPMLAAAGPLAFLFALSWLVPNFAPIGLAVWYGAVFMAFDTCFTVYHISFNSLTPSLASDYDERSSLNGFRMAFSIGGTLAAVIVMILLERLFQDPVRRFAVSGSILGAVCLVPAFLAWKSSAGYDMPADPPGMSVQESIMRTLKNRSFRQVMGLYLFSWTTTAVISSVLVYFVAYYLRRPDQANFFILAAELSAIGFIPAVVALAKRWDKRKAFIVACAIWMGVQCLTALVGRESLGLAYFLAVLSGFGIAAAYVLPWSMIPDVIDQDEAETGERREGSYYSFASFFQKLGTAIALWLIARLLAASGYVVPTASQPYPEQPETAVRALRLCIGLAPAMLLALAVSFALRYSLGRESHRALRAVKTGFGADLKDETEA